MPHPKIDPIGLLSDSKRGELQHMQMTIECAWCHKNLGAKEYQKKWENILSPVTHSICPSCHLKLSNETALLLSKIQQRKIESLAA
jgi:hypothetical protein